MKREAAYLLEDKTVPERMSINAGGLEPLQFSVNRSPKQGSFETWGICSGHDGLVDPVQQPGDRWEEIRLQDSQIFDDSKR